MISEFSEVPNGSIIQIPGGAKCLKYSTSFMVNGTTFKSVYVADGDCVVNWRPIENTEKIQILEKVAYWRSKLNNIEKLIKD